MGLEMLEKELKKKVLSKSGARKTRQTGNIWPGEGSADAHFLTGLFLCRVKTNNGCYRNRKIIKKMSEKIKIQRRYY